LKKILQDPLFRDFFLVGGTGLALQTGHRLSDDLDLFTQSSFDPIRLVPSLQKIGKVIVTGESMNTLNCFIDKTKTDFICYSYPLISDLVYAEGIRMAGIPDIAAMKLSAVAQRGSRKDFYDIYELLNQYSLSELLKFFEKKFPPIDTFHILKSLIYFEDAEKENDPILLKKVSWKQVMQSILKNVREI